MEVGCFHVFMYMYVCAVEEVAEDAPLAPSLSGICTANLYM